MEIDMKSDRDKPNSGVFKKTEKINWKYMILAFASIAITCILLFAGLKVFRDYRNALMKNQQDQLLLHGADLPGAGVGIHHDVVVRAGRPPGTAASSLDL